MNADGSERRRLTQRGGSPAWSPDGKMIAFDRHLATGAELYVMTADGRGERRLMRTDRWRWRSETQFPGGLVAHAEAAVGSDVTSGSTR